MAKKIRTRVWDAVEHLKTEEDMAAHLEAALEDGDPAVIAAVFGDIFHARGKTQVARDAGLGDEKCPLPI